MKYRKECKALTGNNLKNILHSKSIATIETDTFFLIILQCKLRNLNFRGNSPRLPLDPQGVWKS